MGWCAITNKAHTNFINSQNIIKSCQHTDDTRNSQHTGYINAIFYTAHEFLMMTIIQTVPSSVWSIPIHYIYIYIYPQITSKCLKSTWLWNMSKYSKYLMKYSWVSMFPLIGAEKTITGIGMHFPCKMHIWYQKLRKYQ